MSNVTVLMTVYNGMPYLPAAVESIFAQTLREFRFAIVDDGSTDGTGDYLRGLADPRLLVLHQPNQGTALAANHGLAHCNTEFTARMDADDVALPERLARQRAFLLARPEVGLVGTQVAPLGAVRAGRSLRLPLTHDEIYAALAAGRHALAHTSVMGRTDLIKRVGGYWPLPLGEDYDLLLRLGEVARLANLDEVLHHYRVHPGSLNGSSMRRLRLSVDYACELARRRRTGEPRLTLAEFQARRDARPWWRKWGESINLHARCQYRIALAEMYGGRRWRGSLRMAGAAVCSPRLSVERIARILGRFRAERPSSSSIDQSAMGAESTCQ